jgi:ribonuclease H / adenosylcobalamin/alpha-ribazole phosphatase
VLLRHGETVLGRDRYLGSRVDPPLSATGEAEARAARARLRGVTPVVVVASPLRRALETAAIAVPGALPQVDARWAELDFGALSGLTWREVEARFPAVAAAWRRDGLPTAPRVESVAALRARVAAAMLDLAGGGNGDVVVVSHGGPVRTAVALARGLGDAELGQVRAPLGGIRVVRLTPGPLERLRAAAVPPAVAAAPPR